MSDQFEKDILTNVNSFRINPQSIQHQIEVLHRGISRFKANDPFLLEIEAFLKTISSIPKMNPVVINKDLCNVAASEVKKYAKDEKNYNPYRIGKELEGVVPEAYISEYPALIADNGADEAETIVPKLLLNRLDEAKKGRKILCTKEYTQFGVARTRHEDENYYIIILAKGVPKTDGEVTLSVRQKDYVDNYQYYESKFITKKRPPVVVQHKRHGQIGGSEQGSGEPDIYENQTTLTRKEATNIENVNKAFDMISPKKNGYVSRTFNIRMKKGNRIENEGNVIEKNDIKIIKDPAEKRKERKKEKKEEKKEEKIEEKKEERKPERKRERREERKEEKKEEKIVEQKIEKIVETKVEKVVEEKVEDKKERKKLIHEKIEEKKIEVQPEEDNNEKGEKSSKVRSIRRRFYKSNKNN